MTKFQIAVFDAKSYDESSLTEAQNELSTEFAFNFIKEKLSPESADKAQGHNAVCVFVNDDCSKVTLEKLSSVGVQLVLARCAGFDFIDLEATKSLGISVARVPAYSPYAVAEMALALLMSVNRRIPLACQRVWRNDFTLPGLEGRDIHGKTIGLLGTGKIGQSFGAIALGMGCKILAFDKYPDAQFAEKENVQYVSLERALQESDVISLHMPLTPETKHCINKNTISTMKRGVIIINTARGGLIDSSALLEALETGQVGGAGLDVYENERMYFFNDCSDRVMEDRVLEGLNKSETCVITSHQAFLTIEALHNIATTTLENALEFQSGKRGSELTNAL